MKNNWIIKFLISYLIITLFLAGCKKENSPTEPSLNPSEFVGTWKLTKVTVTLSGNNVELTPEQAETQMTIVAKSDGSFIMTTIKKDSTTGENVTTVLTGTWKIANGKIELKYSDGTSESLEFTLTGNKCTIKTTVQALGTTLPAVLEFTKQ
ncbi:MAG: lipocalin family protein [Stygiobacter sp.]|uniref:Lipocalin family protein n=1 Tax=Stygiobacter electus TaxID=3032292 RepID=A0AAE3P1X4_9BACT|nr:lipocalin family protein [Stygiobacter electus]MDF1611305.1 lipocalin family protein [Stygiobacter electus]